MSYTPPGGAVLILSLAVARAEEVDVSLLVEQGWLAVEAERFSEARDRALAAIAADGERADAHALYGESMQRCGLGAQERIEERGRALRPVEVSPLVGHLADRDWKAVRADIAAAEDAVELVPLWSATDPAAARLRDQALARAERALAGEDLAGLLAQRRVLRAAGLPVAAVEAELARREVALPSGAPLTPVERGTLARQLATEADPQLPAASAADLFGLVEQLDVPLRKAHRYEALAAVWAEVEARTDAPAAYAREADAWLAGGSVDRALTAADRAVAEAAGPQRTDLGATDGDRLRADLAAALLVRARVRWARGDTSLALGDYGAAVVLARKVLDDKLAEQLQTVGIPEQRTLGARYAGPVPAEAALQVDLRTADPVEVSTRAADARFLAAAGTGTGAPLASAHELYGPLFGRAFALGASAKQAQGDLAGARADAVLATVLAGRPSDWALRGELHRALGETDAAFFAFVRARAAGVPDLEDDLAETYRGLAEWQRVADEIGGPIVVAKAPPPPTKVVVARPTPGRPATAPRLGEPFPPFAIESGSGTWGSANLSGHTTVLVFWDTTCAECPSLLPSFGALGRKLRTAGRDVTVIGIGLDIDRQRYAAVADPNAEKLQMVWDPTLRGPFAITDVPTIWVVDPRGVARFLFDHPLSATELERYLQQID